MKAFLLSFCLLAGAAIAADDSPINKWESGSFSLLPRSFQKDPHLNVMINTEFTAVGRKAPRADGHHPIYYQIHSGGLVEEGDVIAGEKPPTEAGLALILHRTLASGGYLESSAAHPATILIFYRFGSFNKMSAIDDPTGTQPTTLPQDTQELQNMVERAGLVGGSKFAVEMLRALNAGLVTQFEHRSPRNEFLMQEVYNNRYFVIATAYDIAAAAYQQKVILWRTKISTDSNGVEMDESLPGLIAVAGPYFGHETDGPVRLNRPIIRNGTVTVGDAIVKGVLPSDTPTNPPPVSPAKSHP